MNGNEKKRETFFAIALLLPLLLVMPGFVLADGGHVPPRPSPGVQPYRVFEPNQQAVVAWNNDREILILATTIYANAPTRVLRLIPFPSEPQVEQGDWTTFDFLKQYQTRYQEDYGIMPGAMGAAAESKAQVVFHKRVGTHTLTAVRVEDAGELEGFTQGYEAASGLKFDFTEIRPIVANYVARGVKYFVFDLIEVDVEPRDTNPVIYSFDSKYAFYPLEISSTTQGRADVALYLITPAGAQEIHDAKDPMTPSRLPLSFAGSHSLAAYELLKVGRNVSELMRGGTGSETVGEADLRVYTYSGQLRDLTQDFVIKMSGNGESRALPGSEEDYSSLLWLTAGVLLVCAALAFYAFKRWYL